MCRYESEGDPKGRSDCDSLRDDNALVHDMNEKLREEIRTLREEIRTLREERRWVPVGERLPEKYQSVLVALTPDSKGRVEVCEAVHWKGSDFETDKGNYECSHWMPLPPGPEGEG
jgi:hypothetical protein